MPNVDVSAYVIAIQEQLSQHLQNLNELRALQDQRALQFAERLAVERSMQVMVEALIGVSKHYLRRKNKPIPSESGKPVVEALSLMNMPQAQVTAMKHAVGMRNAIVHDYINLDWDKVSDVLSEKQYDDIANSVRTLTQGLAGE